MIKKNLDYPQNVSVDTLIFTGVMGDVNSSVTVAHGLLGDKILAILPKVATATNSGVGPNTTATGLEYSVKHDGTNITLTTTLANSNTVINKAFFVTVLYMTV